MKTPTCPDCGNSDRIDAVREDCGGKPALYRAVCGCGRACCRNSTHGTPETPNMINRSIVGHWHVLMKFLLRGNNGTESLRERVAMAIREIQPGMAESLPPDRESELDEIRREVRQHSSVTDFVSSLSDQQLSGKADKLVSLYTAFMQANRDDL